MAAKNKPRSVIINPKILWELKKLAAENGDTIKNLVETAVSKAYGIKIPEKVIK